MRSSRVARQTENSAALKYLMRVFVVKERRAGETRVAATPESVQRLVGLGCRVVVESGAGAASFAGDGAYERAGAEIATGPQSADVVLCVRPPELASLQRGALVIGLLEPWSGPEIWRRLEAGGLSALALELLPRISRAQGMDALSSQASVAGYRAALVAAQEVPRYFPMLMTAAGTIRGARVLVIGAGVAGLQAIATARRLGAVVEATDVRDAVREEIQSLGARFISPPAAEVSAQAEGGYARDLGADYAARQREVLADAIGRADAVITTAAVPGGRAPILISHSMVETMKPGAVIVDLAAESGGNCELTVADERVRHGEVLILGPTNLPATMPGDASALYAKNLLALLESLMVEGQIRLDDSDEIVRGALMARNGAIMDQAPARRFGLIGDNMQQRDFVQGG